MDEHLPTIVALLVAIVGGAGGFAALMRVNTDNSRTVAAGATDVVKLLRDQVADLDARLVAVERYSHEMEVWSGRVTALLERAVDRLPIKERDPFRLESEALDRARPRRRRLTTETAP